MLLFFCFFFICGFGSYYYKCLAQKDSIKSVWLEYRLRKCVWCVCSKVFVYLQGFVFVSVYVYAFVCLYVSKCVCLFVCLIMCMFIVFICVYVLEMN